MGDMTQQSEMVIPGVHPRAQPYFFPGREVGCLLIHGFTGSPPELLPLGEYLAGQGYAVMAPLLAGHGTKVEDLARTSWPDWLKSAADGLERLRAEPVDRIYLIGLSMGGLLSLLLAADTAEAGGLASEAGVSNLVAGVVTLNTPIFLRKQTARFSSLMQWILPYTSKTFDVVSREEADALRFAYPTLPLSGVGNLIRLIREVKEQLPRVKVPALVVQSSVDETVRPDSGEFIYQNLGSPRKNLLRLEKAPHLLTLGSERELVFQAVLDLILEDEVEK